MLRNILIIGAGSAIGGMCRYLLSLFLPASGTSPIPWGTLAANLLGCLMIGFIYGLASSRVSVPQHWLLFLTTGFCGGLTTFSTFIHEEYMLLSPGRITIFALYAAISLGLGLLCAWLGHSLARLL